LIIRDDKRRSQSHEDIAYTGKKLCRGGVEAEGKGGKKLETDSTEGKEEPGLNMLGKNK